MEFVWNTHKAALNVQKHDVRFERACEVFLDPLAKVMDASVPGEARDGLLGAARKRELLFVVHIERGGEAIRIISARYATAMERKIYEEYA